MSVPWKGVDSPPEVVRRWNNLADDWAAGVAIETDVAITVGVGIAAGVAVEAEIAIPASGTAATAVNAGVATELQVAPAATTRTTRYAGIASELDSAPRAVGAFGYSARVFQDNPGLYWRFSATGIAYDASGHGRDSDIPQYEHVQTTGPSLLPGDSDLSVGGAYNAVARFHGTGDPSIPERWGSTATYEMLVKVNRGVVASVDLAQQGLFIAPESSFFAGMTLQLENSLLRVRWVDPNDNVSSTRYVNGPMLNDGRAHHVVVVTKVGVDSDPSFINLYVDGVLVGNTSIKQFQSYGISQLTVETRTGVWVDEFAVYDDALSDSTIYSHYMTTGLQQALEVDTAPAAKANQQIAALSAGELDAAPAASGLTSFHSGPGLEDQVAVPPALQADLVAGVAVETDTALATSLAFSVETGIETDIAPVAKMALPPVYLFKTSVGLLRLEDEEIQVSIPEFQLEVLDPIITWGPGVVTVAVSGGLPEAAIEFFIDGILVWETTLDSSGSLTQASIGIYAGSSADKGVHEIEARQEMLDGTVITATGQYECLQNPATNPANTVPDVSPVEIDGTVSHGTRHWVLQDLFPTAQGGLGSYILPINPAEMTSPHVENRFTSRRTLAKSGQFHIFQVGRVASEWKFSGYAPTQEMVEKLQEYRALNRRFYVIDHHNRAWTVVFVHVDLKAKLRHNFNGEITDWGHDYEVTALILEQNWKVPV